MQTWSSSHPLPKWFGLQSGKPPDNHVSPNTCESGKDAGCCHRHPERCATHRQHPTGHLTTAPARSATSSAVRRPPSVATGPRTNKDGASPLVKYDRAASATIPAAPTITDPPTKGASFLATLRGSERSHGQRAPSPAVLELGEPLLGLTAASRSTERAQAEEQRDGLATTPPVVAVGGNRTLAPVQALPWSTGYRC